MNQNKLPELVKVWGDGSLYILGQEHFPVDISEPRDENNILELEYEGQKFTGSQRWYSDSVKELAEKVRQYLEPKREAELRKLADWEAGNPIRP